MISEVGFVPKLNYHCLAYCGSLSPLPCPALTPLSQDLKDLMRKAGDVTYADAHKDRRNEGSVVVMLRECQHVG